MTERQIPDPIDELRRANPADVDQLSSASLARVRARVQEMTMTNVADAPRTRWLGIPRALALGGGTAVLVAVAAAVLLAGPTSPPVVPGPSGGPAVGLCVEHYSLETLRNRTFAFDGTVIAMGGGEVTFHVGTSFRGVSPGELVLTVPGMGDVAITPVGGPDLAVGGRYLVAGDDRFIWGCGFTQAYDPDVAASWASTLRD